jgi:GR25 family glycosyltransferase involved in LPS biosynthesis
MTPVVIVAHPERESLVANLALQVNPDAICWDRAGIGAGRNHLAAWEWLADSGAPWGVVLEDDVLIAPRFRRQLAHALHYSPEPILSLYLGRGTPVQWQQRIAQKITSDVSYLTANSLISAQGYAMRTELFRDHAAVKSLLSYRCRIDNAISKWAREGGVGVAYCRQSLVDHIDGPTLINDHGDGRRRNGKTALITTDSTGGENYPEIRKAWLFGSATSDWTRGTLSL